MIEDFILIDLFFIVFFNFWGFFILEFSSFLRMRIFFIIQRFLRIDIR